MVSFLCVESFNYYLKLYYETISKTSNDERVLIQFNSIKLYLNSAFNNGLCHKADL